MSIKKLKVIQRKAHVVPDTINEENRTVDLTFSTGAEVKRFPFFEEPFIEQLGMKPSNVRLDRLNNGAPFLNNHNAHDLNDVIGVVEKASVRNGEGTATVRFSKREDADKIFQDVKDGIIRNISVGYRVHEFTEQKVPEGEMRVLRATDWEPMELSAVGIPADAGAQFRNDCEENDCIIIQNEGGTEMTDAEKKALEEKRKLEATRKIEADKKIEAAKVIKPEVDTDAIRAEAVKVERERVVGIRKALKAGEFNEKFTGQLLDGNVSLERAREMIIDNLAEQSKARTVSVTAGGQDENESRREGAVRALLNRHNPTKYKLEGDDNYGHDYRYVSLMDMVKDCAQRAGNSTRGMSPMQILSRGLHSTSDFPLLLADVANKTLRDAYAEAPATYAPITRNVTVNDFKNINRNQWGDAPALEEVPESGEYTHGTISEAREQYAVATFGKIVAMTRKMLINDDLGAFARLPEMMGRSARDLESDLLWAQITSNPLMGDGVALFASAHGNLLSAAAISVASLGLGRAAMRNQTGLDGQLLNIQSQFLMVPAELETIAQQFTRQISPTQGSEVNPFSGALQVITEPRISTGTGGSADDWYLSASTSQIDVLELAKLPGGESPTIESKEGFSVDGVQMKVRHDIGVKVIDHRGMQKNPGS